VRGIKFSALKVGTAACATMTDVVATPESIDVAVAAPASAAPAPALRHRCTGLPEPSEDAKDAAGAAAGSAAVAVKDTTERVGQMTLRMGVAEARAELDRMMKDNKAFADAQNPTPPPSTRELREELACHGQKPKATIIACSDSRVAPEVLFRARVGDMFVVRTAGNIAKDVAVLASVEYAILNLKTSLILVLGHEKCGAVTAAIDYKRDPAAFENMAPNLKDHVANMADCFDLDAHGDDDHDTCVANFVESHAVGVLAALRSESACVREHEESGDILLVAGVYDISSGHVRVVMS
jgi:carbonic anhydrase